VLFTLALSTTLAGLAIPVARDALDEMRTAMAARYLSARLMGARIEAVTRSASVGLRFEAAGSDYSYAAFRDGNGNGARAADVSAGIDSRLTAPETLGDRIAGVQFGLLAGVPDVDGDPDTGSDGVRIGTARILTMSPDGTATAGTLYLHGRKGQYAVRVLGITGRVRVLQYRQGSRQWVTR
jgi:Type II transport protein GspH